MQKKSTEPLKLFISGGFNAGKNAKAFNKAIISKRTGFFMEKPLLGKRMAKKQYFYS